MQVLLYQKTIKYKKEDGTQASFPRFLAKYRNKTFETTLSNDCKKDLEKEMAKNDLDFPINMEVVEYFPKAVKYTNSKGEQKTKTQLVILNYKHIEQAVFDNPTLDDIIDELENKNLPPITDEKLPF